ncbi:uncharacterized protein LOC120352453 isoform X2 [Nilaparvata lugens]|uniref:uncharacterized protein LOC120352453 isoform X2 n=1 Tax=Nilaparvata lugens TaxID=108931 RepID=UPI00193CCBE2|nr:uncharacterized protein LOC120352453 isoform X2 [Nilaparvata lugens]
MEMKRLLSFSAGRTTNATNLTVVRERGSEGNSWLTQRRAIDSVGCCRAAVESGLGFGIGTRSRKEEVSEAEVGKRSMTSLHCTAVAANHTTPSLSQDRLVFFQEPSSSLAKLTVHSLSLFN